MTLTKNTQLPETENTSPHDPQKTGSGSPKAPGGAASPKMTAEEMTAGQESYPGGRPAGEDNKVGANR